MCLTAHYLKLAANKTLCQHRINFFKQGTYTIILFQISSKVNQVNRSSSFKGVIPRQLKWYHCLRAISDRSKANLYEMIMISIQGAIKLSNEGLMCLIFI